MHVPNTQVLKSGNYRVQRWLRCKYKLIGGGKNKQIIFSAYMQEGKKERVSHSYEDSLKSILSRAATNRKGGYSQG